MTFAILNLTRTLPLILAATFATASALMAQDTTAPATDAAPAADAAPATTTEQPAAQAAGTTTVNPDNLSMGVEVGGDGVGSMYVEAKFDAWEQHCIKTADGADPCQLFQLLKDAEGNAVAQIRIFNLKNAGNAVAGAEIIVPLETLLTENLVMAIDTSKPRAYPFTVCASMGCIASIGLTAAEIEQFKKGAKATLTIVPFGAPDVKVTTDLSLKGFTAGYAAVSATNP